MYRSGENSPNTVLNKLDTRAMVSYGSLRQVQAGMSSCYGRVQYPPLCPARTPTVHSKTFLILAEYLIGGRNTVLDMIRKGQYSDIIPHV